MKSKNWYVIIIVLLTSIEGFAQTFTSTTDIWTGDGIYGQKTIYVCNAAQITWSCPNYGNAFNYEWESNSNLLQILETNKNNAKIYVGTNAQLNCKVRVPSTGKLIASYTFDFSFGNCNSTLTYERVEPSSTISSGQQVTFIIPYYGGIQDDIHAYWSAESATILNTTNNSITFIANASGSLDVMVELHTSHAFFGRYRKNFNVASSGGGGGGGGCSRCIYLVASPNPSTGKFKLNFEKGDEISDELEVASKSLRDVVIFDSSQTEIFNGIYGADDEIDFQEILPRSGLYIVVVKVNNKSYRTKIMIEK